jgi:uncharacterized protein (DUF983 family)
MHTKSDTGDIVIEEPHRPFWTSIRRGMLNTCPACGSGRLFKSFLKPVDACSACGTDMTHQRADDLPPYLVIVVVGHVLLTAYMLTDDILPKALWVQFLIWVPLTVLTAVAIIQPIKGGVIGLQWALRMHGFGGIDPNDPKDEPEDHQ